MRYRPLNTIFFPTNETMKNKSNKKEIIGMKKKKRANTINTHTYSLTKAVINFHLKYCQVPLPSSTETKTKFQSNSTSHTLLATTDRICQTEFTTASLYLFIKKMCGLYSVLQIAIAEKK